MVDKMENPNRKSFHSVSQLYKNDIISCCNILTTGRSEALSDFATSSETPEASDFANL
jgi:hypothetical protein